MMSAGRAAALASLAPQLTGSLLRDALKAVLAIDDERSRAAALASLAPQLTGELQHVALEAALEAALAIDDERSRAAALASLVPHLTGELQHVALEAVLKAALAIDDERSRAAALASLIPHLTAVGIQSEVLMKILSLVMTIVANRSHERALTVLSPQRSGGTQHVGAQTVVDTISIIATNKLRQIDLAQVVAWGLNTDLQPETFALVLCRVLENYYQHGTRDRLLAFVADAAEAGLFTSPLVSQLSLREMYSSIIEVGTKWIWL